MKKEIVREIKQKWDYRILTMSVILTSAGVIFPMMFQKYGIDPIVSIILGVIVSIIGNLVSSRAAKLKCIVTEIIYKL